jgi:hypothetical protein
MNLRLRKEETLGNDYIFRNSPQAICRFPFPFSEDKYMYSGDIEPHVKGALGSVIELAIDIDEHYIAECKERAMVLEKDPKRYQALPHTWDAQWDTLELIMESLAQSSPEYFLLTKQGNRWLWENRLLNILQVFTFGDTATLPYEPLEYITRQVQGEWIVLNQRDNRLFMDAGTVTRQDCPFDFELGMAFSEWRGSIPMAYEFGVFNRVLQLLLNLKVGEAARRLNWTITINPKWGALVENHPTCGPGQSTVMLDDVGEKVHLRVEVQALWRLPRSNGIAFRVRHYYISMNELVTVTKWAKRLHRVLKSLPEALVDFKGLARCHGTVVEWLSQFDDGATLTSGTAPE